MQAISYSNDSIFNVPRECRSNWFLALYWAQVHAFNLVKVLKNISWYFLPGDDCRRINVSCQNISTPHTIQM